MLFVHGAECSDGCCQVQQQHYYAFRYALSKNRQADNHKFMIYGHFPTMAVGCILDFTMTWIHTHLDYYRYTGDASLMKEHYDRIEKAVNFFNNYVEKSYL